jgi:alpha-L-rhamnosidase
MKGIVNYSLLIIHFLLWGCKGSVETASLEVTGLTCEYLVEPLSVDTAHPRLAWKIRQSETAKKGQVQTAYQILVASSPEKLEAGEGDLWDTGKLKSSRSVQVVYEGDEPEAMQRCWWKVRVWNNHGEVTPWSKPAMYGRGITQWTGKWIGDQPDTELRKYKEYVAAHHNKEDFDAQYWMNPPCPPSPLLRKNFDVKSRIKKATLYASALGYYEMWLNGERIGTQLQAPEWTNYEDNVQYQTYDLTGQVKNGENVLAATLADGWATGRMGGIKWMRSFPHRGFYALDRRLIAQLVLELEDGATRMVSTDGTWKINPDGYIRMADNFLGETIDAGKIPDGWTNTGFDDSNWSNAYVDKEEKRNLTAQKNEPIRVHTELKPVKIRVWKDKYIVDFGQNIAGHCALKIKGKKGQTVSIRHGEWINPDGSIYTQSLGYAKSTDTFILSGGEDYFDPSFTYHGFQYAEVSGLAGLLTADMITAKAVSSDPAISGTFECSNPHLNKLYENIVWTQRNNMFSVLHDNPSRDERTGATGDVQIFSQAAIFNMNMGAFFTKFVSDEKDVASNGQFFSMIPSLRHKGFWEGWIGAPGWCEAGLIVPWRMYENYADTRALESLYAEMKRHVDATLSENPGLIWKVRHNHNGDWLNANTLSNPLDATYRTDRGSTPDDVFATAFFAYSSRLLAKIAAVLNHPDDVRKYDRLADDIKAKFIREYVGTDGEVEGNTQGAYSLALYYDLIPRELREKAFGHLVECIEEYDYRLSTGFISTPMMMQLLVDFGRTDIAYRLLESTRFPSWLYPVTLGATTVWERWDAFVPGRGFQSAGMNSLDHVAFGAVSEWMFRHILGINPDINYPGYEHFTIHPRPGGTLTYAKGSYNSIRGEIASAWKMENGMFTLQVAIPANTTATVVLPTSNPDAIFPQDGGTEKLCPVVVGNETAIELGSGKYTFAIINR